MSAFTKKIRNNLFAAATFWKKSFVREGLKLSLQGASPRVRYSLFKNYEKEELRLCRRVLDTNDRILEVGSSIGFIAMFCIKNMGIRDFAMVEANPELFAIMKFNFAANAIPFPTYLNVAAGPVDGVARFNIGKDYVSSSLVERENEQRSITVEQKTLPKIIESLGFRPNVLIMDIEGAEVNIPVSHFALFDKIITELHPHIVGAEKIDALVDELIAAGFVIAGQEKSSFAFVRNAELHLAA